jgi:hypothetical protein
LSYVHKHLEPNMHILKTLGLNRILSSVRKDNLVLYAMSCRIRWKNQTWSSSSILEISLWHLNILLSFSWTCHHIMSDIGDLSCTTMQDVAVNVSTLKGYLYLFFQLTDVLVCLTQFSHQLWSHVTFLNQCQLHDHHGGLFQFSYKLR